MTENNSNKSTTSNNEFEQTLANGIARELLTEQRRNRRWGIFFKLLLAVYLFSFLAIFIQGRWNLETPKLGGGKHTALIQISGAIGADSEASADNIVTGLRRAFEDKNTQGIILRINSPGGSPVQAGYVNDEIYRLREQNPEIPIYAVISDICASGGYYIASAADEIYANKASLVGSIGVIMSGFGYVDAIDKLGIERRTRHAGESKDFLDPFVPPREEELVHVDTLLDDIYQQFITVVKKGRGERLKDDERIFSGLIWTGEQSVELGLADGLASASHVAREIIGAEDIVNFSYQQSYLDRFAKQLGATVADSLINSLNIELK